MRLLLFRGGGKTTTFDEYANWADAYEYGKEAIEATYQRRETANEMVEMTDADYKNLKENLEQNVTSLAEKNPNIDFYLFFPPFSIYYWDWLKQNGELERYVESERTAAEILLKYENIYLFAFDDEFDMICNPDNYMDYAHYGEWINSRMLLWMRTGEHRLKEENYQDYYEQIYKFYLEYDYDRLLSSP